MSATPKLPGSGGSYVLEGSKLKQTVAPPKDASAPKPKPRRQKAAPKPAVKPPLKEA